MLVIFFGSSGYAPLGTCFCKSPQCHMFSKRWAKQGPSPQRDFASGEVSLGCVWMRSRKRKGERRMFCFFSSLPGAHPWVVNLDHVAMGSHRRISLRLTCLAKVQRQQRHLSLALARAPTSTSLQVTDPELLSSSSPPSPVILAPALADMNIGRGTLAKEMKTGVGTSILHGEGNLSLFSNVPVAVLILVSKQRKGTS